MGLLVAVLFAIGSAWDIVAVIVLASVSIPALLLCLDQLLRYGTIEYRIDLTLVRSSHMTVCSARHSGASSRGRKVASASSRRRSIRCSEQRRLLSNTLRGSIYYHIYPMPPRSSRCLTDNPSVQNR